MVRRHPDRARELLLEAVRRSEGNLSAAAKLMGTTYVVATRLAHHLAAWPDIDLIRRAVIRRRMVVPVKVAALRGHDGADPRHPRRLHPGGVWGIERKVK